MSIPDDRLVHLTTVEALRRVIVLCIENADDEEFVASMVALRGFEVFSNFPIWRAYERVNHHAANGEVFPAGRDGELFMTAYDLEGSRAGLVWLRSRLKATKAVPVSGRKRDGMTQRVVYLAAGTKLEEAFRRPPRERNRETVRLTEDG